MDKKGFTLIELLAVIVILAVIALIATPAVLNVIEDSKQSAAEASARNIVSAAKTHYMSLVMEGISISEIDALSEELKYDGKKPEKGYIIFDEDGNAYIKMYQYGYCVTSEADNNIKSEKINISECLVNMKKVFFSIEADATIEYSTKEYEYGDKLGTLPIPVRNGYIFNGWKNSNGNIITENYIITDNLTLYAKWIGKEYTVTFDYNVESINNTTEKKVMGEKYGILPTPTREGYEFKGWKLGNKTITSETIMTTANDHTLEAQWKFLPYLNAGNPVYYDVMNGNICNISGTTMYHVDNSIMGFNGILSGENSRKTTDNQTSCLKFYILKETESGRKTLLLDHNTTGKVDWITVEDYKNAAGDDTSCTSSRCSYKGPITALKKLQEDTDEWNGTKTPTTYKDAKYGYVINYDNYKSRLVSSSDIYNVTGSSIFKENKYAWLKDYTSNCKQNGCNIEDPSTFCYWTSSASLSTNVIHVSYGVLNNAFGLGDVCGIRPVIELE